MDCIGQILITFLITFFHLSLSSLMERKGGKEPPPPPIGGKDLRGISPTQRSGLKG
jgi:hypothetical protein